MQCLLQGSKERVKIAGALKAQIPQGFHGYVFKDKVGGGMVYDQPVDWLVGGEVIGSQHLQPSASNRSGV